MTSSPMRRASAPAPATLAYVVAVLFLVRWFGSFLVAGRSPIPIGDGSLAGALLGVAPHLLLFPVVAALPAPIWGRAAGWGWLVIDMTSDILALNGVPPTLFLPLRYGGHVSAAVWLTAASWPATGSLRPVGLLAALDLGGYSFLAPFVSFVALLPAGVLLPAWFVLVGRRLAERSGSATPQSRD
jgi:hypothetical protein